MEHGSAGYGEGFGSFSGIDGMTGGPVAGGVPQSARR